MPPLVSVCFPLYRSLRFLDIIVANIDAITYPNTEFLISDRHLYDDALDQLRARYGHDPRFRFFAAHDNLNWVEHFNWLAEHARGKYSLWMGHDDTYSPNYIPALVAALEADPSAVLAFGDTRLASLDGFLPAAPPDPPPLIAGAPWTTADAVRLLTLWQPWVAFRGLARRELVAGHPLPIRLTRGNVRADIYWVFALSLRGRLVYVPEVHCTKRFYKGSGGSTWTIGLRQSLNACKVLHSYWRDHAPPRAPATAMLRVYAWALVQGLLPAPAARRLGIWVRRLALAPNQ